MRRRIILHIGQMKTGTSAIQAYLARHRRALARQGVLVPRTPGSARHTLLSLYARPDSVVEHQPAWAYQRFATPERMREHLRRGLRREIARSRCDTVLLSDEAIYGLGRRSLQAIAELMGELGDELVIVVYLRRQDEQAISGYKQTVRLGRSHSLHAFLDKEANLEDWHYHERLLALQAAFPGATLRVRPYHRSRLAAVPLIEDFCETVGATPIPETAETVANPSLDAVRCEFLRRCNALRGRMPPSFVKTLVALSDGPDLRLSEEDHRRFAARFEASNAALVEAFLPDCADIFLAPPAPGEGLCQDEVSVDQLVETSLRLLERQAAPSRRVPSLGEIVAHLRQRAARLSGRAALL